MCGKSPSKDLEDLICAKSRRVTPRMFFPPSLPLGRANPDEIICDCESRLDARSTRATPTLILYDTHVHCRVTHVLCRVTHTGLKGVIKHISMSLQACSKYVLAMRIQAYIVFLQHTNVLRVYVCRDIWIGGRGIIS